MSVMIDGAEALLADRKAEVVDYRSIILIIRIKSRIYQFYFYYQFMQQQKSAQLPCCDKMYLNKGKVLYCNT